tara:strand:- start:110 stop:1015 length:906 start_codon:yes stop_codon:yes gene_type:complete
MIIYNNFNIKDKFKNSVLAIGNFDGLHKGHQKVLNQAKLRARRNNLRAGCLTFEPVPVMFFNKKIKNHRLSTLNQKIELLKKQNLDFVIIVKFNKKFSNLTADEFIKKIIYKKLKSKFVLVSRNFKFGKNREGDIKKLKHNEKIYDYKTEITFPLKKDKLVISSTRIRRLITAGKIQEANKMLGQNWTLEGKVIRGEQRGRKIGFPTCNLKLNDYIIPRMGVYSVLVNIGKIIKKGIANIGYRPTFGKNSLLLEVNIFGIKKNLYKKSIRVKFIKFIRAEKKFRNIEELKRQIKKDIKKIR